MTPLVSALRIPKYRTRLVVMMGLVLLIGQGFIAPAFSAQKSDAKNLNSASAQIAPAQESKVKDPDTVVTSTAFTYQGQLKDSSDPVNGVFDFQFVVYSAQTGGERLGANEMKDMALTNGLFSFKLDFGRAAVGTKESWLEIGVRPNGHSGPYTVLFPRQKLSPTPYAIFAQHEQWSLIGVPVGFADRAVLQAGTTIGTEAEGATKLKQDESPNTDAQAAVSPQGTPNVIAKFDGNGNPLANSTLFDNGSNVGIGTTSLNHRLSIIGGPVWTSNGWTGSIELGNASAIGWQANAAGQRFGLGHTGAGFFIFRTASNPGTAGTPAIYDFAIDDTGNVGVGTTSPDTRLNVNSSAANSQAALTVSNGNADTRLALWSGYNAGANPPAVLYTHDLRFGTVTAANFASGAGFTEAMRITRGGSVGIAGEVTIANVLHLNNIGCAAGIGVVTPLSCSNYMIVGQTNGNTFINSSGAGNIHFRHNNNEADQMEIRADGTTAVRVLQILGGSDVSEQFEVSAPDTASDETHKNVIDPGTVVSIDPENPGKLLVSHQAYDRRVAGIVSGAGGIKPGMLMGQEGTVADGAHPVALTGRVYCWADASNGPIEPGDFLTTAETPGHAMKVTDRMKAQGAIIGKAMTRLEASRGLVLVLVTLQ